MFDGIPNGWKQRLGPALRDPEVEKLGRWLEVKRDAQDLIPRHDQVFRALQLTPFDQVRVVILGQDPYPTPGCADGLAFSVPRDAGQPATLRNILAEVARDIPKCDRLAASEPHDDRETLAPWARQGVLLLNTALTLQAGEKGQRTAESNPDWAHLTRAIVEVVAEQREHVVFILWGMKAIDAGHGVDGHRHTVIRSTHPASRSWRRESSRAQTFYGSSPFSLANRALHAHGQPSIHWRLDN